MGRPATPYACHYSTWRDRRPLGGALPGLTATMALALMLPFTFSLEALEGLVALGAVYMGTIYGGAFTAILINTPGTPSSIAAISSVIGGVVGIAFLLIAGRCLFIQVSLLSHGSRRLQFHLHQAHRPRPLFRRLTQGSLVLQGLSPRPSPRPDMPPEKKDGRAIHLSR